MSVWPLHLAASRGDLPLVEALLATDTGKTMINDRKNDLFRTPLHEAAQMGHTEVVAALLRAGADIDVGDGLATTPLVMAIEAGHIDVVLELISAGADVDHPDGFFRTALYRAAPTRRLDVLAVLISAGADVNARAVTNVTPLWEACVSDNWPVISYLIAAGADPEIASFTGFGPRERLVGSDVAKFDKILDSITSPIKLLQSLRTDQLSSCSLLSADVARCIGSYVIGQDCFLLWSRLAHEALPDQDGAGPWPRSQRSFSNPEFCAHFHGIRGDKNYH